MIDHSDGLRPHIYYDVGCLVSNVILYSTNFLDIKKAGIDDSDMSVEKVVGGVARVSSIEGSTKAITKPVIDAFGKVLNP